MTKQEQQVLSNMIDSEYYSRQNPMAKDEVLVSIAQNLDLPNKEELTTAFFNTYGRIVKQN
jgi:predicted DsbA family dithiol-disulfide isomerase